MKKEKKRKTKKAENLIKHCKGALTLLLLCVLSLPFVFKEVRPSSVLKPITDNKPFPKIGSPDSEIPSVSTHASLPYLKGGDIKMVFSDTPTLGKTSQVTVTFTPHYNAPTCRAFFMVDKGIEFSGEGINVATPHPYLLLTEKKKIKLQKGIPFTFVLNIKPIRPGVWNVSFNIYYTTYDVPGMSTARAFEGYRLVITEEETHIYSIQDKVPIEYYTITSYIGIVPPSDKGRKEEKKFAAYFLKDPRLDFEPTYQFQAGYQFCCGALPLSIVETGLSPHEKLLKRREEIKKLGMKKPRGNPVWSIVGNLGTIDENGLFTATHFGKGKIRVEHGKWLWDEIDIEVVPHPHPSPPDKIVEVIVVPYETEDEKAWVQQVLTKHKGKSFKSKKEARNSTLKPEPNAILYRWRDEQDKEHEAVLQNGKILFGTQPPSSETYKKPVLVKRVSLKEGPFKFFAFGITASGGLTIKEKKGEIAAGMSKLGGNLKVIKQGATWLVDGTSLGLGEIQVNVVELGFYSVSGIVLFVEP